MRDVLEQDGQVPPRLVGLGRGVEHGVVGVEVTPHQEARVGGEGEQLARLQLVPLAPVEVVHQQPEASHVQLQRHHLHAVAARHRGGDSAVRYSAPHQHSAAAGTVCSGE